MVAAPDRAAQDMEPRKSFLLRMDPALWADLERWAQEELRSVNGQIEYILRQAVLKRKGPAAQERDAREPSAQRRHAQDPTPPATRKNP